MKSSIMLHFMRLGLYCLPKYLFRGFQVYKGLTLYPIITPLKYMYHVYENIMEKGAFALLEQMLHFP